MAYRHGEKLDVSGGFSPEQQERATREKNWRQRVADLEIVREAAMETPLVFASRRVGRNNALVFKLESKQPNRSFKLRGPYYAMKKRQEELQNTGVTVNSAGNHIQGTVLAAKLLGIAVDGYIPKGTPPNKVAATKDLAGDNFRLHSQYPNLEQAGDAARLEAENKGKMYLSPYDDEDIIRGNATLATEVLIQLGEQEDEAKRYVHGVHAAVGGGGLISALADVNHELGGLYELYGAEPEGANSGTLSFNEKEVVRLANEPDTTAEGLAVRALGNLAHQRMLEGKVTGMRTVTLASVGNAYEWYFDNVLPELGVDPADEDEVWANMPEVSAMVAVAGALEHLEQEDVFNETHLVVISGGNTDREKAEKTMLKYHLSGVRFGQVQKCASSPSGQRSYTKSPYTLAPESQNPLTTKTRICYSLSA